MRRDDGNHTEDALALAGAAARELLTLRELVEVERRVLEWLLRCSGATWAALYRAASSGGYRRASCCPADLDHLPDRLPPDLLPSLLVGDGVIRPCQLETRGVFPDAALFVPLPSDSELHPPVLFCGPSAGAEYGSRELEALHLVVEVCSTALDNAELVEQLRAQVFVDVVTGCYNRRAFEEHLNVELVRARRYERPLCLLLLDLDDFKQINDAFGHPAGDYALKKVGEVLRTTFRTTDRVCRYGGDEFAVIFPETQKEDVVRLAERLRRQIADLFPDTVIAQQMTASIGVAGYPRDAARPGDLVGAADLALYGAKSAGRNQVEPA